MTTEVGFNTSYNPSNTGPSVPKTIPYDDDSSGHDTALVGSDGEPKQAGVQRVEAITTVWSKGMLITMFILLYLVTFVEQLLQSVQANLVAYVTSAFAQHGLLGITSIVATIVGGVCNLFISKVIDIWGRVEGFCFMLVLIIAGMIMKATCTNVEMYAAANTLYWVGHIGMDFVIQIILADITSLRNRIIMFGIVNTPRIATTFAGPAIAELFVEQVNFRWAFGAFLIILTAFCIPVCVIFIVSKNKAIKLGVYPPRPKTRTYWESLKYYFVQFDVIGMVLTISGWSLLLLPFSLVRYAPNGWKTGYIIAMIVLGLFLLVAFGIWERYFSPVPYIPFKFLKNRTILGACVVYGVMFASIFCWDSYYYSYLQVVHQQSISHAGYILNSFSLMSSFIGPFVGLVLRYWGSPKWFSISVIPFAVLGTALLIHFRTPESHVGYLVMCQLFSGVYSGVWALTGQLVIMASVNHQDIAVALALHSLYGAIGAAVGSAIAGALWTNIFPVKLYEFLPEESKNLTLTIYGDINQQMAYYGTPIGDAIIHAYADVQRKMVITGVCLIPVCLIFLFIWRNIDTKKIEEVKGKQTKGRVW
ncbi:hypothetical protein VNI00_019118 [Paramarasmius palmivorus]|uniref:Siderophore iron transporter mirB n=1 Tax=Paramarasmius palmivorus TaxID=297713 RepID=A0AAW0AQW8_9AGAR